MSFVGTCFIGNSEWRRKSDERLQIPHAILASLLIVSVLTKGNDLGQRTLILRTYLLQSSLVVEYEFWTERRLVRRVLHLLPRKNEKQDKKQ
jgi:hypothetical protein